MVHAKDSIKRGAIWTTLIIASQMDITDKMGIPRV
jgi:hypothetical protein